MDYGFWPTLKCSLVLLKKNEVVKLKYKGAIKRERKL